MRPPEPQPPRVSPALIVAVAAVTGAAVMVVEVLGSRVIGPFFGVSLFVWTALIAVTLLALAAGYFVGGRLADHRRSPDLLFAVIVAAGLLVAAVPALKGPVLRLVGGAGLRTGALLSSLALFGPALFCLGCVSPFLARLAARDVETIGGTVGTLYAVSTAGSFAGTVLAGYVLIARFGVGAILAGVGASLAALGLAWFVLVRRRPAALGAGVALVALLPLAGTGGALEKTQANGVRAVRRADRDTFYGNLKVLDHERGALHTRSLMIDGQVQGGIDVADGRSVYAYPYLLELIPWAAAPGGRTCLVVGLGAGVVPAWYEARGVATDVVEINPAVAAVAREHFGWRPGRGSLHLEDARSFLRRAPGRYDYLILDVFNGDTTPAHLLSLEAFRLVRERLAPGGLVALNLIGSLAGPESFATRAALATLGEVFPHVEAFPLFDPAPGAHGNVVVVAGDRPIRPDPARLRLADVHPVVARLVLPRLAAPAPRPAPEPGARPVTDDFNPLDVADLPAKERDRRELLAHADWDLLL